MRPKRREGSRETERGEYRATGVFIEHATEVKGRVHTKKKEREGGTKGRGERDGGRKYLRNAQQPRVKDKPFPLC